MNIILVPGVSDIKDGLELEEIKETVGDEHRYEGENISGSYTFIGATEDDQPKIVTVTLKKKGQVWIALEAHEATADERQKREEVVGESG